MHESAPPFPVYTVGHSTRSIEEFVGILKAHGIEQLIDIRTIPKSRRNPQFNRESLPKSLAEAGIEYRHLSALGGLRRARSDSLNTAWRNASFRGYADYMQTPAFRQSLGKLIELGAEKRTAIMCAEAVPWRCHRSLVADALLARGVHVEEILSEGKVRPHAMTPFAHVEAGEVSYPAAGPDANI
ncbi:MAG TPA: DUF488 domain-containing protein [Terriglobales bacterium]|nr:DUF488 domain-containing protein [Terriglobales bacterium]